MRRADAASHSRFPQQRCSYLLSSFLGRHQWCGQFHRPQQQGYSLAVWPFIYVHRLSNISDAVSGSLQFSGCLYSAHLTEPLYFTNLVILYALCRYYVCRRANQWSPQVSAWAREPVESQIRSVSTNAFGAELFGENRHIDLLLPREVQRTPG